MLELISGRRSLQVVLLLRRYLQRLEIILLVRHLRWHGLELLLEELGLCLLILLINNLSNLPLMLRLTPHLPLLLSTIFCRCLLKLMLHLLMLALMLLRLLLVAEEKFCVGQGSVVILNLSLLLLVLLIGQQKFTLILHLLLLLLVEDMRELISLRHGLIHLLRGLLHGRSR